MKIFIIICSIYLFFISFGDCAKGKKTKKAEKVDEASIESALSRDEIVGSLAAKYAVVSLNDKNFTKFVIERPRNYYAAVMLTATAPKYQCEVCVVTKATFVDVASFYQLQYDWNTINSESRIAFFVVEVDQAKNTFNDLGLETVPRVYILPPKKVSDPKLSMSEFEVDNRVFLRGNAEVISAIEDATKVKVV